MPGLGMNGWAIVTPKHHQWVQQAAAGDKDALSNLLEAHGPGVEAALVISQKWQGALDAADVMQVTYLEAFSQIGRFDLTRADAFPAWLRRIAENNLRDAIRSLEARKNAPPRPMLDAHGSDSSLALLDVLTSGAGTPSRTVRTEEARDRLHQALARLPSDYARAVRHYDLEGKPIEEVAALLGRSAGAVYMLRQRAHDRLRTLLGNPASFLESNP